MRSPYRSPTEAPPSRFLRRRPSEGGGRKRRLIWIGAGAAAAYLVYALVLSDTGILRILSLKHENETLERQKADLTLRVDEAERLRKVDARDPLLEERAARERYHLVKKDEILYRYQEPDSAR